MVNVGHLSNIAVDRCQNPDKNLEYYTKATHLVGATVTINVFSFVFFIGCLSILHTSCGIYSIVLCLQTMLFVFRSAVWRFAFYLKRVILPLIVVNIEFECGGNDAGVLDCFCERVLEHRVNS